MQDEVTIEKRTPVDGDFYFICKGKMLLAKTWTQEEANIIANAFSLRAELEQATAQSTAMREALTIARGALLLDHMVDYDGNPFGTTTEALEAIDEALSSDAGAALLEELKKLREFVGAVNYMVESMPEGMNHYCDVLRKPLAELYAKEGDHETE